MGSFSTFAAAALEALEEKDPRASTWRLNSFVEDIKSLESKPRTLEISYGRYSIAYGGKVPTEIGVAARQFTDGDRSGALQTLTAVAAEVANPAHNYINQPLALARISTIQYSLGDEEAARKTWLDAASTLATCTPGAP